MQQPALILFIMCRNRQLIEERNRRIAQAYHELAPRLRNYSDVVTALSQMFFLSEFRIQAIIRDMVRKGTFVAGEPVTPMPRKGKKAADSPVQVNIQLQFSF